MSKVRTFADDATLVDMIDAAIGDPVNGDTYVDMMADVYRWDSRYENFELRFPARRVARLYVPVWCLTCGMATTHGTLEGREAEHLKHDGAHDAHWVAEDVEHDVLHDDFDLIRLRLTLAAALGDEVAERDLPH